MLDNRRHGRPRDNAAHSCENGAVQLRVLRCSVQTTTWLLAFGLGLGCNATPSKGGPEAGAKQAPAPSDAVKSVPLADQAAAFLAAPGSDTHGKVDWELSTMAKALRNLRSAESMDPATLAEATGSADALGAMVKDLEALTFSDEAARSRKSFEVKWKGATGCTAAPKTDLVAMMPSEKLTARLSAPLTAAGRKLSRAHSFDVDCAEFGAIVVLSDEGMVLALMGPREKQDPAVKVDLLENRFVGYMNQADEVPAE